jgi:acetyl-CoA carboxylase biotin carboxylase subunit
MEEAPSPIVDDEMRRRMGEIAVRAAKVAHYTNAGTVEFLVDQSRNFYFLEMNTRLQVEHPVTELVTGLDLVQMQIGIAAGEQLTIRQQDVQIRGHAIECRIYAEDPDNNYFPSPGRITRLISPAGPGIRRDGGIYEGWTVPIEYDPLLSKLSAYGPTRTDAINRMRRALVEVFIGGIKTNISLFRRILLHPEFQAGNFDTGFLDRLLPEPKPIDERTRMRIPIAAIAAALFAQVESRGGPEISSLKGSRNGAVREPPRKPVSNWKRSARKEALH